LDWLIGASVSWIPVGYGDPLFPEKRPIALRSLAGCTQAHIIFPNLAANLIVGLRKEVAESEVRAELAAHNLQEVKVYDFFATANCRPFEEPAICREL